MSIDSTLAAGRDARERLMSDRCTIARPAAGPGVLDEETGRYTAQAVTELYAGRCTVRVNVSAGSDPTVGDAAAVVLEHVVEVPVSVTGVEPGDLVTVTAAAHDAALTGTHLRVVSVPVKSYATARRFVCEEVTRAA